MRDEITDECREELIRHHFANDNYISFDQPQAARSARQETVPNTRQAEKRSLSKIRPQGIWTARQSIQTWEGRS